MNQDPLHFNGIDGASCKYLIPLMTPQHLSEIVRGEPWDAGHLKELTWWHQRIGQEHLGPTRRE